MSESVVLIPSLAYLASTMLTIIGDQVKAFFSKYEIYGVCSPAPGSIDFVCKNTSASHVVFVNLDQLVDQECDDDDRRKIKESGLQLNRTIYSKAKKIVASVQDIIQGSSKSVQHIVFMSQDSKLLKYIGARVSYFIPSSNYLLENPDEKIDEKIRNDLVKRKADKLVIFNHKNQFLDMICQKYKTKINI